MALPGAVRALGLGDIRIDSALNEPLSAQIDIVGATRDELAALTASVANHEIFQRYGADRPGFLSTATFKVGVDGQGHPVLNVRSAEAFTDPVVSFLVDLRWGKNEIVREYSLLLDPPGYKYPRGASEVAFASATAAPVTPVVRPSPIVAARNTRAVRSEGPPAGHSLVRVASGDTLRGIARRAGAKTEPQAQTLMIAIFRANPGAFDGNINRMHRNAILTLPTSEELAAISGADAKREVRAHMSAWRLDGRPASSNRVAANEAAHAAVTTAPPRVARETETPDAALKTRVQTLQQQLDEVHKQLENETAQIQNLKEASQKVSAQPAHTAAPAATVTAAPAVASATTAAPAAETPVPAEPAAKAPVQSAELVAAPIVAPRPVKVPVVVHTSAPEAPTRSAEIFGPVVVSLGLLVAGFAYVQRRLALATASTADTSAPFMADEPAFVAALSGAAPAAAASAPMVVVAKTAPKASEAPNPEIMAEASREAPQRPESATPDILDLSDTFDQSMPEGAAENTAGLEIDIEALERSYLDSLPPDPTLAETTTLETVAIDAPDEDTAAVEADLNTVLLDPADLGRPPVAGEEEKLDFDLLDLDATERHVQMPSGLGEEHAVMEERRTNIVDVLKSAIERDPNRRDLRMKLLETYYNVASANKHAFMDEVRKLSREKDALSPEDWKKITMMGREIAADDILFADLDPPNSGVAA